MNKGKIMVFIPSEESMLENVFYNKKTNKLQYDKITVWKQDYITPVFLYEVSDEPIPNQYNGLILNIKTGELLMHFDDGKDVGLDESWKAVTATNNYAYRSHENIRLIKLEEVNNYIKYYNDEEVIPESESVTKIGILLRETANQ